MCCLAGYNEDITWSSDNKIKINKSLCTCQWIGNIPPSYVKLNKAVCEQIVENIYTAYVIQCPV